MKDRSVRCALWLRKQGIGENDVVSLSTPNQINDYVPYLATLYINAIVNPWPSNVPAETAQHFFKICRPRIVFACKDSIDKLVKVAKDNRIDCKFVTFDMHEEHLSLERIIAEQIPNEVETFECSVPLEPRKKVSRILFSSGTTGKPKAIMLSYHGLLTRRGSRSGMTCLWSSQMNWITGANCTLNCIQMRCTRIVCSKLEVEEIASIIEKYKINLLFLSRHLLMQCQQEKIFTGSDFTSLDTILFSGAKMNKAVLEKCRKSLPNTIVTGTYGATECGGMVLTQTTNCKYIDSAGYVCSDVKLKIVDPNTGAVLGPRQLGELYVKVDTVMLGYFRDPEETKRAIDEDGWLRSGDLGSYDEDGEVMIIGRLTAVIRAKYFNISPLEIEEVLMEYPGVNDCAVIGVKHAIDIERPFAFVVKAPDAKVTTEDLIQFTASKNEHYRLTGGLAFVEKLPLAYNGKRCLKTLHEMAMEQ